MFKCGAVLLKMVDCLATATAVTATAVTAATYYYCCCYSVSILSMLLTDKLYILQKQYLI